MGPHPDFVDGMPETATIADLHLTPLGPADLVEDFAAVTESAEALSGLFGDTWPAGLTLERNLEELMWHRKEFRDRRSFAWVLRGAAAGDYRGCAYLYPEIGGRGTARAFVWFRTGALAPVAAAEATGAILAWLRATAPVPVSFQDPG